jgi:hypothetical protein
MMGILSDFLVANRSEAATTDRGAWPRSKGRITVLELTQLHFALTGEDGDEPTGKTAVHPFTGAKYPITRSMVFLSGLECLVDEGES